MRTSVLIPARNEPYLQQTIDDLFAKAQREIEIIVILDGYWPNPVIKDHKNLKLIHFAPARGMRHAINAAARIAQGKFLLKCDAHCMFDEKFDEKLTLDCDESTVLVPVRYTLDPATWTRDNKAHEFQYIRKEDFKGKGWPEFASRVKGQALCDLMTTQGSCWFMRKETFSKLGGLDDEHFGQMGREAQEVSLKAWLSGGKFLLTRRTWYAHWSKPVEHVISMKKDKLKSAAYILRAFEDGRWKQQLYPLSWLIEKFSPVPTW
jgi:glycosyltransferase involved in cell wall biosynthesis